MFLKIKLDTKFVDEDCFSMFFVLFFGRRVLLVFFWYLVMILACFEPQKSQDRYIFLGFYCTWAPKGLRLRPKATKVDQKAPKVSKRRPKGDQKATKDDQSRPKGDQKATKVDQKAINRRPESSLV